MGLLNILHNVAIEGDVSVDGEFTLENTQWDDLRFPATAINPPGQVSDPDFDTTNGGYLFDGASTETIFMIGQLPHGYKEATDLYPHVHWQKTTSASGNVFWRLSYKWARIAEVMDAGFTDIDQTSVMAATPDNDTTNEHLMSAFAAIDGTGTQISDMLVMKLSRMGGEASDTYNGADARLLEFDIHYEINSFGSASASTK